MVESLSSPVVVLIVLVLAVIVWNARQSKHLNKSEFRHLTAEIIQSRWPGTALRLPDDDIETIWHGEAKIGLHHLYTAYLNDKPKGRVLREGIAAHFENFFAAIAQLEHETSWEEVRSQVRPQLMPEAYAEQGIELVTDTLGGGVRSGYVIDTEHSYVYVRKADLEAWGISQTDLHRQAQENLGAASADMPMQFIDGPNKLLMAEMKDGFDAVRILLPELREQAIEKLGEPFFAGIPNRDFLAMWSRDGDPKFLERVQEKIRKDFSTQPYALTPTVFEVTRETLTPAE